MARPVSNSGNAERAWEVFFFACIGKFRARLWSWCGFNSMQLVGGMLPVHTGIFSSILSHTKSQLKNVFIVKIETLILNTQKVQSKKVPWVFCFNAPILVPKFPVCQSVPAAAAPGTAIAALSPASWSFESQAQIYLRGNFSYQHISKLPGKPRHLTAKMWAFWQLPIFVRLLHKAQGAALITK